jgi:hypothetical protein
MQCNSSSCSSEKISCPQCGFVIEETIFFRCPRCLTEIVKACTGCKGCKKYD